MKFHARPPSFHNETRYAVRMSMDGASFAITLPPETAPQTALVFASPHSGQTYPDDMGAVAGLSRSSLRSAEDALVGALVRAGPDHGAPLIEARIGRAYLDLNRDPAELDPGLIDDVEGPVGAKTRAGYGLIPRLTGDGLALYDRRLSRAEADARIRAAHAPYHAALADLMARTHARCGRAVLIDWHSMPARAVGAEVVLGDRHGSSCSTRLTRRLRDLFEAMGWRVALNHPYAGGWSTQVWGRPDEGYEAIQIELSRSLYLDEARQTPNAAHGATTKALNRVITALCAEDWADGAPT
ncbi:N-formylglutamate amidohydrolase [Brevundimonas sp. SL130]|uniref:N-formylglutamate amidohydrolase n=1 Tax=Brevundimonas sp. SL130 TaxID=2995143 RepID=UPI00226CA51E|nr:N-formylglutamate amidohydrolase [Brevundimonas sp. SL130]WAC59742.1 N-formylglutamate amidohydrolase [Brevundimonas sp. SL130]